MTCLRLSLVGGHQVTVEVDADEARTVYVLLGKVWTLPDPVGVITFRDHPAVMVSARDVVMAETLQEGPCP